LPLQQLPHEALPRMLTPGKRMLASEVPIDPLGRQTRRHRRFNDHLPGHT
jgi:hypothetical protein